MVEHDTRRKRWNGHAMKALAANSLTLEIFCADLFPGGMKGDFTPGLTTSPITTTNDSGVTTTRQVNTVNHITAVWKSLSDKSYPPRVVKGEQVVLYQEGNGDKFYWDSKGRDSELRTTDRLRTYVSATPNANEIKDDTNTYFQELDSDNKRATILKTSSKNGEPVKVYIGVDTASGLLVITDDKGVTESGDLAQIQNTAPSNFFIMDFVNNVFQMTNNDKSTVQLNKRDIIVACERDMLFTAKRQIVLNSPIITINKDKIGTLVVNAKDVSINATSAIVMTATVFGINASTKIAGTLIAGATRLVSMVTGALNGSYAGATSDITAGTAQASTNQVDSDTAGDSDRHVAAWEDVNKAFGATASAISQVASAAKTSVDTSGITSNAESAQITILKGE